MNKFESASILAGISPNKDPQALAPTNLHAITGEVVGQSDNGKVLISMDGMVFTGDDSQYVEMDTIGGLEEGDISTILLTGENGKAMRPLAIGSAGSIDRIRSTVESAETLAQQADAVAAATGQHFWTGDDGVHVTEVTQEDWNDAESPDYHSGSNVLLNALGQLFRDGLNNLMAVLPQNELVEAFVCPDVSPATFVQFTTSERPRSIVSVTVDGEVPSYPWHMNKRGVYFSGNASFRPHEGQEVVVTYISVSSLAIFDGLGNYASNVTAKFSDAFVSLAKGVFQLEVGDVSYGSQTVSMALSPDDEQHAEIRLTKDINNDRAYIALQADNSTSFAAIIVDTGGAFTGRVADFAYVDTLHFTESTFIPIAQANVGLLQPSATYTGSDTTATASSSGWTISHMNNVQGDSGVSDYFTFSNGVITALRDELLEISGVAYWNSGPVGQYGFGFFIGSSTVNSGTEKSVFSYKASASGQFSVAMPPRCVPVTAGTKIAVARYSINGSVYRNGTNMSFVTIRVVQDRSS